MKFDAFQGITKLLYTAYKKKCAFTGDSKMLLLIADKLLTNKYFNTPRKCVWLYNTV